MWNDLRQNTPTPIFLHRVIHVLDGVHFILLNVSSGFECVMFIEWVPRYVFGPCLVVCKFTVTSHVLFLCNVHIKIVILKGVHFCDLQIRHTFLHTHKMHTVYVTIALNMHCFHRYWDFTQMFISVSCTHLQR